MTSIFQATVNIFQENFTLKTLISVKLVNYDCATVGKWFKIAASINKPAVFYRQDSADGQAIWEKLNQDNLLELKNFFSISN